MAAVDITEPATVSTGLNELKTAGSEKSGLKGSIDHEVRVISVSEYKAAANALAEAFWNDHTARYFLDTPGRAHWTEEKKWKLHLSMMEYITYAHCLKGLVVTAGPGYGCVALWMPPGNNMDDWLTLFRSGTWRLNYKLCREGKARFFTEFLPLLNTTKLSVLGPRDDDSYYLVYVGTRPAARGKGYARKCIDFVTKRADAEGRPCYLESSDEVNLRIYGKMGFEVMTRIELKRAEEEVTLDIMVREPTCMVTNGFVSAKSIGEKNVMVAATVEVNEAMTKGGTLVNATSVVEELNVVA